MENDIKVVVFGNAGSGFEDIKYWAPHSRSFKLLPAQGIELL